MDYPLSTLRSFADVAMDFRKLEPWKYWDERQYFGIENDRSGEIDWVSIMGSRGEHRSLVIYLGVQGFQGFNKLVAGPDDFGTETDQRDTVLNQIMLKIYYGNRNEMEEEDLEIFKRLKINPKGQYQFFQVRSFMPYHYPVMPDQVQLKYITDVLRISILLFEDYQKAGLQLVEGSKHLMLRSLENERNLDFYYEEPPALQAELALPVLHPFLLNRIKREVPRSDDLEHCFGVMILTRPIKEEGDDCPVFPSLLFSIMRDSGQIHRIQLIKDSSDHGALQKFMLEELTALGSIPATILIDSSKAALILESLCDELGIEMFLAPDEEEFTDFAEGILKMNLE
ncbi:MAG: hypothetical protein IPL46_20175 [Saprospiraceae bacterium]|nr:hypothetical protein [Saprospiraceae bacterium]